MILGTILDKESEKEDRESMNENDRERLIRSGKQLLSTIYDHEEMDIPELEKGKSYLLKEKKPEKGLRLSLEKMEKEGTGYCLLGSNPKEIKKRFRISEDSISFYWLTRLEGENRFDPSELPLISHNMINFLQQNGGPIFMEGVESILKYNSFSRFLGVLDHLVDVVDVEDGIFILNLDPRTLSEQRLAQIERKLELV